VVTITLPALRDRPKDIEPLAQHFIAKYAEANGMPTPALGPTIQKLLQNHVWRGNVRELENTMHRAVLLAQDGVVTEDSLLLTGTLDPSGVEEVTQANTTADTAQPPAAAGNGVRALVGNTVADVERDLILDTLQHCLGNRTHAANILGISIRTLRNKLKLYSQGGIAIPMPGSAVPSPA
jgi:DNA-binding NtrC family response regulator